MEVIFQKQYNNFVIRKVKETIKDLEIEGLGGVKKHVDSVDIHSYTMTSASGNFSVFWREDSLIYNLIEKFIGDESKECEAALQMMFYNIFMVGASCDIVHHFTAEDGNTVTDGLHMAILEAICAYKKRVITYKPQEGDELGAEIIEDLKRVLGAVQTLGEVVTELGKEAKD